MAASVQICTFLLGGRTFAVPVAEVQEVVKQVASTPVPLTTGAVRGLANLRGQIALAVDLGRRLGMPERPADAAEVNVVVRGEDGPVCLVVDEIGDVLDLDTAALERPPETLPPAVRDVVRGICKLDDELVLLLDTTRAVDVGALPGAAPAHRRTDEEKP